MSLRRSFNLVFSTLLTLLAVCAAVFAYQAARKEAWDILDFQLQQISRLVGDGSGLEQEAASHTQNDELVVVRILFADGRAPRSNVPTLRFPDQPSPGFSTFEDGQEEWRLFTAEIPANRLVMVAQRTSEREELAADAARNSAWPFLVAIPVSWLVAAWLVGAIIDRLRKLAGLVEQRHIDDTTPLADEDVPLEVRPLVTAMNHAFDRVRATIDQQRAFIADAAHELRTPVAALALQLDNLKESRTAEERAEGLADLQAGVRRASQVAVQLLSLARSESRGAVSATASTRGDIAIQECLSRFVPLAEAKAIDLGIGNLEPFSLRLDSADLATILDPLVDNALRYTEAGGQVDVSGLSTGALATITVTDNGRGIPPDLQERVFDRFFRIDQTQGDGSGLGLSIVRALVDRSGGTVRLEGNSAGQGLQVVLRWPLDPETSLSPF